VVQEDVALDSDLGEGHYQLTASWNEEQIASRSFRVVDWNELLPSPPGEDLDTPVSKEKGISMFGALLKRNEGEADA